MASTRKRRDESVLLAISPGPFDPPPPALTTSDSTRDAVELMIPLNSFSRTCRTKREKFRVRFCSIFSNHFVFTDSPMFKRSVVNASDTREWPPGILQSAVISWAKKRKINAAIRV